MIEIQGTELVRKYLSPRARDAHKGMFGHVLIIGGGFGMPGSVMLAANAALRSGAGCVTVATRKEYAAHALSGLPEAMISGIDSERDLTPLLAKASVAVLGPGLGDDEWAQKIAQQTLTSALPLVIDASGLRLLANLDCKYLEKMREARNPWILTPHPGEAAALLSCSTKQIQSSREKSAEQLQLQYGGVIVLKGNGTIVVNEQCQSFVCKAGNPGMATAGMGDVLSGVIGALLAQGIAAGDAAQLGVWLHATAGDMSAHQNGERGMLASDLFPFLRQLSNPLKSK